MNTYRTLTSALLLFGVLDMLALVAVVMPFGWMAAIHASLGLGTLPSEPIVEYFARHVSLWYAVHAATLLFLASDVSHYRPMIHFISWLGIAFAVILAGVNIASELPTWWTLAHFLGGSFEAIVLLALVRRTTPSERSETERLQE